MKPEEYIKNRLQPQSEWYAKKSRESKKIFNRLRTTEIVAAALIPFTSGITASISNLLIPGSIVTGLLGVMLTIIAGIIALGQYQENWIKYRTTRESLKKEKILYDAAMSPYNTEEAFPILVQRVESLISKENTNWAEYVSKTDDQKDQ